MFGKVWTGRRFETPHETTWSKKKEFHCNACTKTVYRRDIKMKHEASCFRWRRENEQMEKFQSRNHTGCAFTTSKDSGELEGECQSALDGNLKSIQMTQRQNEKYDLSLFLQGKRTNVLKHLEKEVKGKKRVQWFISAQVMRIHFSTKHILKNISYFIPQEVYCHFNFVNYEMVRSKHDFQLVLQKQCP